MCFLKYDGGHTHTHTDRHAHYNTLLPAWGRIVNVDGNHHHHHHLFAQTRRRTHDQHENKSRTRKAQKTGAYILPMEWNGAVIIITVIKICRADALAAVL